MLGVLGDAVLASAELHEIRIIDRDAEAVLPDRGGGHRGTAAGLGQATSLGHAGGAMDFGCGAGDGAGTVC